ncbi:MAG: zinc-ribbon domain-containing protein [Candidatus Bathyarchaeia archaeon]
MYRFGYCVVCGTTNPVGQRFCPRCGTPLPQPGPGPTGICPACYFRNSPAARFCVRCGSVLSGL